jgi:ParB-like chromosome segregation protein Spo0J
MKLTPAAIDKATIDPEFAAAMNPLTGTEYDDLVAMLKADGCREKIIVWGPKFLIVDGHHRYKICCKHKIRLAGFLAADFPDRAAALRWIRKNQLARRNLTPFQATELALKNQPKLAEEAKARKSENLKKGQCFPDVPNSAHRGIEPPQNSAEGRTRDAVAAAAGVSHDTVAKVETILASGDEKIIEAARTNDISINAAAKAVADKKADTPAQDQVGRPLPTHGKNAKAIGEIFARRGEITGPMSALSKIKGKVAQAAVLDKTRKAVDVLYHKFSVGDFTSAIDRARADLKAIEPYAVCPRCAGDGCTACERRGWMNRLDYEAEPTEFKEAKKE